MPFSVPYNALIIVADGTHITFYRNIGHTGIKLEKAEMLSPSMEDGRGSASLPKETSPHEKGEANFAKHIADDLYTHVHKGGIDALVLIADPQTLGQIRLSLHHEVRNKITGELHKTLTKSSVLEIQKILTAALSE